MNTKCQFIFTFLICFVTITSANDIELGVGSPPALIERVRLLANEQNYQGIDALLSEIDLQYHGLYTLDYFRELVGVYTGVDKSIGDELSQEYAGVWMKRKIVWKIVLSPNTYPRDTREVLELKEELTGNGLRCPFPVHGFDYDQFLSLRMDAYELLKAYGRVLQAQIIPNYIRKSQVGSMSVSSLEIPTPEQIQRQKQDFEESEKNKIENNAQTLLSAQYRRLFYPTRSLALDFFNCPPREDRVVADLVKSFPYSPDSDIKFLFDYNEACKHMVRLMKEHPQDFSRIPTWVTDTM